MVDQGELIDQYRATLQVMKDKLFTLKEEKQRKLQEIMKKQNSSSEFQKLGQTLEVLQESIQSLNLEIFKEKGTLRKTKAETDWHEDRVKTSEKFQSLTQELNSLNTKNQELKTEKITSNGDSKLAQLEHSNPKLFILVKKMIAVEEANFLLKQEISYLEQERNKSRSDYHKITQSLGQEEKLRIKLRELEKDSERSLSNIKYYEHRYKDLESILEYEKEKIGLSGTRDLIDRLSILQEKKSESSQLISTLAETLETLENEIVAERNCENKEPPTNLKYEIKNLESEITEKAKELKQKVLEKKKLLAELDSKMKLNGNSRRSSTKNTRENFYKSTKHTISKSSNSLISQEVVKRDALVGILGKNLVENKPKELKHFLRHVGSQDQGIATKLVQLNRGEFLKRLKLK